MMDEKIRKSSQVGIYKIWINDSSYIYIGQSKDLGKRNRSHIWDLKRGLHNNPKLQNAYNKYGAYHFEVVELCSEERLNEREVYYIKKQNSLSPRGYNLKEGGDSGRHTEETKAKISAANKGKKRSEEAKANMSAANKGKKHSEESKAKMSAAKKGRKRSEEAKANISAALKGNKNALGNKGFLGRKHTEETKANMSAAKKGRKGKKHSEETKAKISAALKGNKNALGNKSFLGAAGEL